ncbi:MAG: hypothetical protein GXO77_02920 [Calditrichaeota bacterium]|nr:hypothetical protein [Calditrichota bacterium]
MKIDKKIVISIFIFFSLIFVSEIFAGDSPAEDFQTDECYKCHLENDALPKDFNKEDIHLKSGLTCAGCHGGDATKDDMDEAMDPKAGFIGKPTHEQIPSFCGKCHSHIQYMRKYRPRIPTDQEEQYYTSQHGMLLKKGDQKVAVCSSCHTSHSIFEVKDSRSSVYPLNVPETCNRCHGDKEYMKNYKIPVDQYKKYAKSVHGIALLKKQDTGAPACNDCHGNHGAMPPGISSTSFVCGECHVNNLNYFNESAMGKAFSENELHGCQECHGSHEIEKPTDEMTGVGEESVCLNCHDEGDDGYIAAKKIYEELKSSVALHDSAKIQLDVVKRIGMDDIDIGYKLQKAEQSIIKARTLVHTFDPEKVAKETNLSLKNSKEALELAQKEIKDAQIRRRGLGVATFFILLLIIAVYFKIRNIEAKGKN